MTSPKQDLNAILKKQIVKELAQTLADMKNSEEALTFINDFFDMSELDIFSKRLAIAYWLKKGRSIDNIQTNLKVTRSTIASVKQIMHTNGIKLALKKMEAEEWANIWSQRIRKMIKK